MILVDANVLMYAAGAPHENKGPSVELLERIAGGGIEAALDAEVLQEILHRYRAIRRWEEGRRVYEMARVVFPQIYPITAEVLDGAREHLDAEPSISARDALHASVVDLYALAGICSYDRGFDRVASLARFEPSKIGA